MSAIGSDSWLNGGSSGFLARAYSASDWDVHRGVRIVIPMFQHAAKKTALDKIRAALDLIGLAAPEQLSRIPVTVQSIIVGPARGAAACWRRDLRAILLERDILLAAKTSTEWIATCVIHELTHARLERAGFEYAAERRARIERICYLAERNFLARLPDSTERRRLGRRNASQLASRVDSWSDAAFDARRAQWLAKQPMWRRALLEVITVVRRAHAGARSNDRSA
jgi:hypothetical protein